MERLVGGGGAGLIVRGFHRRQRGIDALPVGLGRPLGGKRRGGRLDDRADFLDGQQQLAIRLVCSGQPGQHVAIEQAPVAAGRTWVPCRGRTLTSPFAASVLIAFAHHAASDAETDFEIVLRRQRSRRRRMTSCAISRPSVVSTVLMRPGLSACLRFSAALGHALSSLPACCAGLPDRLARKRVAGNHRMFNIG